MTKIRGFEIISSLIEDDMINLPRRMTKHAAGYDFESAETITIPSMWDGMLDLIRNIVKHPGHVRHSFVEHWRATKVRTGIKAYMPENEVLYLYARSSIGMKKGLILPNSVGVIDSDYYNNPDNEGEIMFGFINISPFSVVIEKGERIGQGVFMTFLKADNDIEGVTREGGIGSTDG